ncbi:M57 family metalloprotease [Archangium sp.]|jgi:hypothetical protein|uniref:M57 family metalloprotease n=1 Tax=Archangium sp. TaxID=1872627 RepID=UPI002ED9EC9A
MKKVLSLVVFALACGPIEKAPQGETWEQFEKRATRVVDGQVMYMVEWDLAVSHDELRAYYDANIAAGDSSERLGKAGQPLIVNRVNGSDDIWNSTQRHNLRYCVSNEFGSLKDRVRSEMWAATAAWEGAANVRFVYDAAQDGNCTNANPNVLFSVRPWTSDGACAFFPVRGGCVHRTLVINYQSFPNNWTIGILRHELGHVLGFRHEHIRPENGSCGTEDSSWRVVTSYDRPSIMHYPQCNGVTSTWASPWLLTALDRQGAASLYGAGTTPAGTNAIDRSDFFVRQAYRDVLAREPDSGGFTNGVNWLQACNGNQDCLSRARVDFTRSLFESPENRRLHPELDPGSPNYNAAYVTLCYTTFLRRQPDSAGYNWWLNTLNASGDYRAIISGFINSSEYRLRFGPQ